MDQSVGWIEALLLAGLGGGGKHLVAGVGADGVVALAEQVAEVASGAATDIEDAGQAGEGFRGKF